MMYLLTGQQEHEHNLLHKLQLFVVKQTTDFTKNYNNVDINASYFVVIAISVN